MLRSGEFTRKQKLNTTFVSVPKTFVTSEKIIDLYLLYVNCSKSQGFFAMFLFSDNAHSNNNEIIRTLIHYPEHARSKAAYHSVCRLESLYLFHIYL